MSPETLTQNSLQYLAGAAFGKLSLYKLDAARNLVSRQTSAAMVDQVIDSESSSWLQHYASHHEFTPLWIGYSEDHCFANRRMLVNNRLNLTGVNIFAARDNHVLQTVQDVEVPRCILITNISCAKHPISECKQGFFRIGPIATHDIGTPSHQFTGMPGFDLLS